MMSLCPRPPDNPPSTDGANRIEMRGIRAVPKSTTDVPAASAPKLTVVPLEIDGYVPFAGVPN